MKIDELKETAKELRAEGELRIEVADEIDKAVSKIALVKPNRLSLAGRKAISAAARRMHAERRLAKSGARKGPHKVRRAA